MKIHKIKNLSKLRVAPSVERLPFRRININQCDSTLKLLLKYGDLSRLDLFKPLDFNSFKEDSVIKIREISND